MSIDSYKVFFHQFRNFWLVHPHIFTDVHIITFFFFSPKNFIKFICSDEFLPFSVSEFSLVHWYHYILSPSSFSFHQVSWSIFEDMLFLPLFISLHRLFSSSHFNWDDLMVNSIFNIWFDFCTVRPNAFIENIPSINVC